MRTAIIIDARDETIYLLRIPDKISTENMEDYLNEQRDLSDSNWMIVDKVKIVEL